MKKRIALFVVLISLLSIVAEAAFSGKYLCVRRSGKTYKHRLYTAKTDAPSARKIGVQTGGVSLYASANYSAGISFGYLRTRYSGSSLQVYERSGNYLSSFGSFAYNPKDITTDGTYYYVTAGSYVIRVTSGGGTTSWNAGTAPAGIVYHPTLGVLFVVDNANDRVNIINLSGSITGYFGSSGSGNGQFQSPWGIALDGNYVVVQDSDGRTQWFSVTGTSGSFYKVVSTSGNTAVAIDPANGNVYVSNTTTQKIRQYNSSGSYVTEWSTSGPAYGLAVDVNGNIFSTETAGDTIQVFRPGGSPLYPIYGASARETDPYGLTFDQSGILYLVGYASKRIAKFD